MNKLLTISLSILLMFLLTLPAKAEEKEKMKNYITDISVKDINGKDVKLADYEGKVLMIVNVASKCGNTPQYEGLQKIYDEYHKKGFEILGFPCNDFGAQEPGTNEEIKEFCSLNYGVTFPLFDKIKVLGSEKHPLYTKLTNNEITGNSDIGWNFEKFLISKEGKIVKRFHNKTKPEDPKIIAAIEEQLKR